VPRHTPAHAPCPFCELGRFGRLWCIEGCRRAALHLPKPSPRRPCPPSAAPSYRAETVQTVQMGPLRRQRTSARPTPTVQKPSKPSKLSRPGGPPVQRLRGAERPARKGKVYSPRPGRVAERARAGTAALVALGPTVVLAVAHAPTSAGQRRAPRRVAPGRDAVELTGGDWRNHDSCGGGADEWHLDLKRYLT
jgi:hypothetical protein